MKREAYRHPKMMEFAALLGIPRPHAVGLIALLLDWCADVAPQGNIGKWSDATIAMACDWQGDPRTFIDALVESGWVDRCGKHRLVVHDLADHAEQWWRRKLEKLKLDFLAAEPAAEGSVTNSAAQSLNGSVGGSVTGSAGGSVTPSILLTKPNLTKPRARTGACAGASTGLLQISLEVLRDTEALMETFEREVVRTRPLVRDCEADRLRVLGAAERALEDGVNPAALFVDIVKNAKWGLISQAQEDRASDRLKAYRAVAAGCGSLEASLASQLKLKHDSGAIE